MEHSDYIATNRRKLVSISTSMLHGDMDMIEGVRQICDLRLCVDDADNDVFLVFRGVESETDLFPSERIRSNYSTAYLMRLDNEKRDYILEAKQEIVQACREIIRVFS